MDAFRTVLKIQASDWKIDHQSPLLCVGSCFAEEMGSRLKRLKFPVFLNPCGIVYNPLSISRCLEFLLQEKQFEQKDLFEHDGLWHSFDHHGSFSAADAHTVLNKINQSIRAGSAFLRSAKVLVLTLGTAHVFRLKSNFRIVANCHKLPGQQFERLRLQVPEIVSALGNTISALQELNPGLKIILTVSPVRHLRDGLVENNRSKAALLLAVDQLCSDFSKVHYFPAYELLIDDLRDYRFFAEDLSHPNRLALDYIWQRLTDTYFSPATKQLCEEIESLKRAGEHRPFHPASEKHRQFLRQQAEKCRQLAERNPHLDFSEELNYFEREMEG
ncbi:MAG: GSCFA domain-containing protein [Saprospiraceae bacterium]